MLNMTLLTSPPALAHLVNSPPPMCPCDTSNNTLEDTKSELEINANKMREMLRNKTDFLSKIHHRATHSSDAFWASFILTSLGLSIIISVLASRMWMDKECFISYFHSQPTVYAQFMAEEEISVRDMLISKARNASWAQGQDEVDSSQSIYHKLLSSYGDKAGTLSSSYSSDDEEDHYSDDTQMYYYDPLKEEWVMGSRPKRESIWSILWSRKYRRNRVAYKKISHVDEEYILSDPPDSDSSQG